MPDDVDDEPATQVASTSRARPRQTPDSDDDEDEDIDYNGVADIEYEEEFVSGVRILLFCKL